MSKKKGKSLEEKRKIIEGIYHSLKEPLNLKEIESAGAKLGVVSQTIKEVNQSLVDDHMVQQDKIGSGNFFWSFPSKALNDKRNKRAQLEGRIELARSQLVETQEKLAKAAETRSSDDRPNKIRRIDELRAKEKGLDAMIEANRLNDPAEVKRVEALAEIMREGANRWTSNTWSIKSWAMKKKGMSSKEAERLLNMEEDFDDVKDEDVKGGGGGKAKTPKKKGDMNAGGARNF